LDVNAPTDVKQIISQVKSLENKVNAMQKEMEYLRAQSRLQSKVLHVNNQKFKALSVDYDVYVPQTSWTAAVGASTVGQAVAAVTFQSKMKNKSLSKIKIKIKIKKKKLTR